MKRKIPILKSPYEFWEENNLSSELSFAEFAKLIENADLTSEQFTTQNLEAVANGEYKAQAQIKTQFDETTEKTERKVKK